MVCKGVIILKWHYIEKKLWKKSQVIIYANIGEGNQPLPCLIGMATGGFPVFPGFRGCHVASENHQIQYLD